MPRTSLERDPEAIGGLLNGIYLTARDSFTDVIGAFGWTISSGSNGVDWTDEEGALRAIEDIQNRITQYTL